MSKSKIQVGTIVSPHTSRLLFVVLKVHDHFFDATCNVSDDMCVHSKLEEKDVDVVGQLTEEQFKRLGYDTFIR